MLRQPGLDQPGPDSAEDDPRPALSIVVCTCDRHTLLSDAIAAIERQTLAGERFELVIVDNSSDRDAQATFLDGLSVDCRCDYVIEERRGAARARNIGLGLARGDTVAFLDDDTVPDPGWAEAVLARFDADAGIGVVGGPVSPIWPSSRPPWLPPWADGFLSVLDHGPSPRFLSPGEWLFSANLAFRRSVLTEIGGFPEHLGRLGQRLLSNEDIVAVRRAVEAGHAAFYEPRMHVRHHVHADRLTRNWLRRRMAWQVVSDLLAFPDHVPADAAEGRAALARLLGDVEDGPIDLAAVWAERDDPETLAAQLQAVAVLMRLLLA